MDDEIIEVIANELNVSFDDAKEFLSCERGCYADIRDYNNEGIWLSGQLITRLLEAVLES